ncbi:MAG: hypothetical protein A2808_03960 [Candidatus Moranbacteria bacterium RIFCSPHIGHO2_01_FULL_55_24]|nr:MAG: hypothetical protein A2808_03960 [Candidatus Moranbacteria bacterium RIFCSPHIGHO2_01_FULL_55_24]
MNKDAIAYGVIGLLLGVVITGFTAGYAVNNDMRGMMNMIGMWPSSGLQNSKTMMENSDRHFIEQMIPHHEDAIVMADSALEKAQHQEIKNLANDIKRTQSVEIEQMQEWYKNWFGAEVPKDSSVMGSSRMRMGMMGNESDVETLRNASNFDESFIEEMIPHHQMAVMMANMLLVGTNRPEMKKLAEDIISAQTKEINEMRQWMKDWGYTAGNDAGMMQR